MNKDRIREVVRFLIAGIAGFVVELVVLIILKEKFNMDTLIATPIAFVLSVVVNYVMCALWVFPNSRQQSNGRKIAFFITSAVGLLINELFMFLFRIIWGEEQIIINVFSLTISLYVINKILSTCIVMIWNYFTKRQILTSK